MLPFAEDTWGTRIDPAALKNAILKYFPDYGSGDGFSGLQMMEGERLQETPGAELTSTVSHKTGRGAP